MADLYHEYHELAILYIDNYPIVSCPKTIIWHANKLLHKCMRTHTTSLKDREDMDLSLFVKPLELLEAEIRIDKGVHQIPSSLRMASCE